MLVYAIYNIYDKLNLSKHSLRWVLKLLREDQIVLHTEYTFQFLNKFDVNPKAFRIRIVAGYEI